MVQGKFRWLRLVQCPVNDGICEFRDIIENAVHFHKVMGFRGCDSGNDVATGAGLATGAGRTTRVNSCKLKKSSSQSAGGLS